MHKYYLKFGSTLTSTSYDLGVWTEPFHKHYPIMMSTIFAYPDDKVISTEQVYSTEVNPLSPTKSQN